MPRSLPAARPSAATEPQGCQMSPSAQPCKRADGLGPATTSCSTRKIRLLVLSAGLGASLSWFPSRAIRPTKGRLPQLHGATSFASRLPAEWNRPCPCCHSPVTCQCKGTESSIRSRILLLHHPNLHSTGIIKHQQLELLPCERISQAQASVALPLHTCYLGRPSAHSSNRQSGNLTRRRENAGKAPFVLDNKTTQVALYQAPAHRRRRKFVIVPHTADMLDEYEYEFSTSTGTVLMSSVLLESAIRPMPVRAVARLIGPASSGVGRGFTGHAAAMMPTASGRNPNYCSACLWANIWQSHFAIIF